MTTDRRRISEVLICTSLSLHSSAQEWRLNRELLRGARRVASGFVLWMLALGCVACAPVMQLKPEERATLHVGQTVALQMPATYGGLGGGAGDALLLVQKKVGRERIVYLYRAVQPGNQVFLAVSEQRECVSCVTVHWYVTVIQ